MNIFKNTIFGNNVTIINGRVINDRASGKPQTFDETKSQNADNVKSISIDTTFVDVNISASDLTKIEAHFYGHADIDGEMYFDVRRVNCELKITLKGTGNFYNSNLKLDVTVPYKMFESIFVKSASADIILGEDISTELLKVKTQSGDLETNATFDSASISTMSGDVDLFINAKRNIIVEISTMSGDVSAKFYTVGQINLYTHSMSGDIRNLYKPSIGFTADVEISTMSGNIKIR